MMVHDDYNPLLPDTSQINPAKEGGKGIIHTPGGYRNIIWQTRRRLPDNFELKLIAVLEEIFDSGIEELQDIVIALNQRHVYDLEGRCWTEETFQKFLNAYGY